MEEESGVDFKSVCTGILMIIILAGAIFGWTKGIRPGDLMPDFSAWGSEVEAGEDREAPSNLVTANSSKSELKSAVKAMLDSNKLKTTNAICSKVIDGETVGPKTDLLSGKVYYKAIVFLQEATAAGFTIEISCVINGHTNDGLLHPRGKAIDISSINGETVHPNSAETIRFGRWLSDKRQPLAERRALDTLPFMIGGPASAVDSDRTKWSGSARRGPFFTDPGHQTHFHIGFECTPDQPDDFRDCFSNESRSSLRKAYAVAPWR